MKDLDIEEGLELLIKYNKRGGLIPIVVQDYDSKEVLMLAYAERRALEETMKTEYATFWGTSRNELWVKGKTSGDLLLVQKILVDCDQDALVYLVKRIGRGACHTKDAKGNNRKSCFYREIKNDKLEFI
jgi:phosphoribosyl-AMP cyclohydrolase